MGGLSENVQSPSINHTMHTYCAKLNTNQTSIDDVAATKVFGEHAMSSCCREHTVSSAHRMWKSPVKFQIIWECTGPPYQYHGCYSDTGGPYLGRTLPQGLVGQTGVGVKECAAAALSRGFPLFALQGKGQCFFGSPADLARIQASQRLPDAACNDLPCPASAATCRSATNKVYVLIGTHTSLGALSPLRTPNL
jgi:hypothetical protein